MSSSRAFKSKSGVDRTSDKKSVGGRPRKFSEPSRPITVTLPESTLHQLERIHADRSRAIVTLANQALGAQDREAWPLVEIVEVAAKVGLVIVGQTNALARIPFVHPVQVAAGRFVLAFDSGSDIRAFEIAVNDLLEDRPRPTGQDRELLTELLTHLKTLRKSERGTMAQILLVQLDRS
ncbi:MAG: hypothetical protein QOG67_3124 [Verrucomicrobiota bacterium]